MEAADKIVMLAYLEDQKDLVSKKYQFFEESLINFFHLFILKWLQFEGGEKEIIKDDEYHL